MIHEKAQNPAMPINAQNATHYAIKHTIQGYELSLYHDEADDPFVVHTFPRNPGWTEAALAMYEWMAMTIPDAYPHSRTQGKLPLPPDRFMEQVWRTGDSIGAFGLLATGLIAGAFFMINGMAAINLIAVPAGITIAMKIRENIRMMAIGEEGSMVFGGRVAKQMVETWGGIQEADRVAYLMSLPAKRRNAILGELRGMTAPTLSESLALGRGQHRHAGRVKRILRFEKYYEMAIEADQRGQSEREAPVEPQGTDPR